MPNENSVIGLNQELIDQIIESKKCICKRDVSEEIIKYFQDLRAVVPPNDVSAIISDRSDSKVMEINDFKVKLNNLKETSKNLYAERTDLENEIKNISKSIEEEDGEKWRNEAFTTKGALETEIKNLKKVIILFIAN